MLQDSDTGSDTTTDDATPQLIIQEMLLRMVIFNIATNTTPEETELCMKLASEQLTELYSNNIDYINTIASSFTDSITVTRSVTDMLRDLSTDEQPIK